MKKYFNFYNKAVKETTSGTDNVKDMDCHFPFSIGGTPRLAKTEDKWKARFSETAKGRGKDHEISICSENAFKNYLKYFFEYFKPHIKKNNSKTMLLDLGCGPGTYTKILGEKGFRVFGVDSSKEMLKVAKERIDNKKVELILADISNMPFDDNQFDIVICLGVFQTLDNPLKAIKEIKRILKKDGLVIITTLNSFSIFSLKKGKNPGLRWHNPYLFKKMMKNEGFIQTKIKGVYFFSYFLLFMIDVVLRLKIYKFLNLFFPFFMFLSHSFYIEARKG